ncbi:MAG: NAD-dependent deacylase [Microscillaceae bacterium]|jgi:NAD-dependent deacetylase|nr:NAD-dependent deacylase [Microscillaceae bacterium]
MNLRKKIVVLTGAGISAESGLKTFRDSDGLWENYDVMEVASIDGWYKNPELVLRFYNERRAQAFQAQPNEGHKALARLEEYFEVTIVTQNVDNLHEKAGSSNIIHLHGELNKVRSEMYPDIIYDYGDKPIHLGDKCPRGAQLRPHIVWFGEAVPLMEEAIGVTAQADIFMVVGTSLNVYPAAGLIDYVSAEVPKYVIDPHKPPMWKQPNLFFVEEKGTIGVPRVVEEIIAKYGG